MNLLLKIFVICFLLFEVTAQIEENLIEALMNHTINECQAKENATPEDVLAVFQEEEDWPETREGKCFIECFFQEVGIVSFSFRKFSRIK